MNLTRSALVSAAAWLVVAGSLALSSPAYSREPADTPDSMPYSATNNFQIGGLEVPALNSVLINESDTVETLAPDQTDPDAIAPRPTLAGMQTCWGFGVRENKYNATILKAATTVWPHNELALHPLMLKSLIAAESAFNPLAVSWTGAAGLVQLTPETARRFGLTWSTSRDPQCAIPAGVKVLAEKARAILYPSQYHKLMGLNPAGCQYASTVAQAYQQWGEPSPEQYWQLILAAYNGGGGTVLRAMATAHKRGLDPREWSNLVGNRANSTQSPLYLACQQVFGRGASNKYRELAEYPERILNYYRTGANTP